MKGSLYFDGKRWHVSFYTPDGKIHKRFSDKNSAEIFRAGLALKHHEKQLDARDYRHVRQKNLFSRIILLEDREGM